MHPASAQSHNADGLSVIRRPCCGVSISRQNFAARISTSLPTCSTSARTHLESPVDSFDPTVSSPWREEEAREVVSTSPSITKIGLVLRFIRWNPDIAIDLLSKRSIKTLDSFLHRKTHYDHRCDSKSCKARVLVNLLLERQSPTVPTWEGEWIFAAIESFTDIDEIAEKLDASLRDISFLIPYDYWLSMILGYNNAVALNFLNALHHFRDRCNGYELRSRNPLAFWATSTSERSDPFDPLSFWAKEAQQLAADRTHKLIPMLRRFAILATRFHRTSSRKISINYGWPGMAKFAFLDGIEWHTAEYLAKSRTNYVSYLFRRAVQNNRPGSPALQDLASHWLDLSDNVAECVIADSNLGPDILDMARHFIHLGDLNSATAIGFGFSKSSWQPDLSSDTWFLISQFSAAEAHMMKTLCLPYLDLDTLTGSGLTRGNLLSISVYLTQKDIKEVNNRAGPLCESTLDYIRADGSCEGKTVVLYDVFVSVGEP
ncbi:hypothetical protein B0J14DRAFT_561600 [Halenospora varia]|nr:hypothetical protein B0J14DRAFT_561600 [Halenospora varia]